MELMVSTDFGIGAEGESGPLVDDLLRAEIGIPGEAAEAVEIGLREVVAEPVFVEADVGDADEAAGGAVERLAGHQGFHGRRALGGVHVEIEHLLPHGDEEDGVAGLAEVLLGDLQFDGLVGFLQRAEEGRGRFAHLEIDGAVFDLDDDVVVELAVERLEVVVGGAAAVVLRIVPIHVVVVDEAAVEEQAAVGLQGARHHVGGVGVGAAVGGGADAAFGIGLEHEAGEIGDGGVERVDAGLPPGGDVGIERIEGVEAADGFGAAEIDGEGDAHAPGAEGLGDARDLRDEIGGEHAGVGVDVVDGAGVDAERGEQAAVVADAA